MLCVKKCQQWFYLDDGPTSNFKILFFFIFSVIFRNRKINMCFFYNEEKMYYMSFNVCSLLSLILSCIYLTVPGPSCSVESSSLIRD